MDLVVFDILASPAIFTFCSIPTPPFTISAPVDGLDDSVMPSNVTCCFTKSLPSKVVLLPTVSLLLIPTPPSTIKAPVDAFMESVVFITRAIPPMFIFFTIPTPPFTTSAPFVCVVDSVVLLTVATPCRSVVWETYRFRLSETSPLCLKSTTGSSP